MEFEEGGEFPIKGVSNPLTIRVLITWVRQVTCNEMSETPHASSEGFSFKSPINRIVKILSLPIPECEKGITNSLKHGLPFVFCKHE